MSIAKRKNYRHAIQRAALAAAGAALLAWGQAADAASYTWIGGLTGDVNSPQNWSPNGVPSSAAGDTMVFDGSGSDDAELVLRLSNSGNVTGAAGPGILVQITSPKAITIDSTQSLLRFASGTAILVAEGAGAFSLGDGEGSAVAYGVGNASGQTHVFTNHSSNLATINSDIVFNGGGAGTHTLRFNGSGDWTAHNLIRNTANLYESNGLFHIHKEGSGTLTLSHSANVYSGDVRIDGGTVRATSDWALGYGGQYTVGREAGKTIASGAVAAAAIDLAGNITVNEPIVLDGSTHGASLINSVAGSTATVDNGIAAIVLSNGGSDYGSLGWDKVTATITGGGGSGAAVRVWKSGNSAAGVSHVHMTAPGSGYTSAPTVVLNNGEGAGNAVATAVLSSITLSGTNNYIGGDGNLNIAAVIGESTPGSGFIKIGNGITTLSGANTYTGPTVVREGRLVVSGSLSGEAVTVESGAILQLASETALSSSTILSLISPQEGSIVLDADLTIAELRIDGELLPGGVYSATTAPTGFQSVQAVFSGSGTLTVVPEPASVGLMLGGLMVLSTRLGRNR